MFGTLGVFMFNLKNELMKTYGKNNIYLREVLNSDTTLMIFYGGGGQRHGHCVGQVDFIDNEWVGQFDYKTFESALEFEKELYDIGVLN